jgi:hypothetical protein
MMRHAVICGVLLAVGMAGYTYASDWVGFRGVDAQGVSPEKGLAVTWSEQENVEWKIPLPGPGSSSPIVLGEKVFVTCHSGYGLDPDQPGDINNLKRHLVCVGKGDGKVLWDSIVPAVQPEDPYKGMLREHGYASATPVTDGRRVYVFFGKSGVLAFDLDGKQLWQTTVGSMSDKSLWGSAASPALYKDMVIVNAWDESRTLYALDKKTGKEIWKRDLSETGLSYATPVVAGQSDGSTGLIVSLPSQVWGLEPETGETLWFARTGITDSIIPTPVVVDGVVYIHGGGPRSSGSLAVRTGGKGDVTDMHTVWTSKEVSSPPSPVVTDGMMYWAGASGKASCADIRTGEIRYSEQLPVTGRFAIYASPTAAEGKLYVVTRKTGTFVIAAEPKFRVIAHNVLASDESDFNASPAISDKRIILRSNRFMYSIKKTH